jgi:hypothetical protein
MTTPTRFIKAKVDKYIQLFSEYANHSGTLYSSVSTARILTSGTIFYFSEPTLTFTVPPTGGIRATGTFTIVNGVPSVITITNPGFGYTAPPVITISGGGGGTGTAATFATTINLSKKREFVWDLINPIELNENGTLQIVDRVYNNASATTIYTIRILDISSQCVIDTLDGSAIPTQINLTQGKIIDIGIPNKPFITDISFEIQPQTINRITLLIDDGISTNTGIAGNIEFFIALKVVEKEPSVIEYGTLNNINTSQI